ncbi:hypothetical protein WA026_008092 [Henosepilachna vigintioctopunctata]|uniref:N-acetyltransferase domain-containing protein n=1 Tax=Henosepilachna vigintioctopunctata TaxID=420089 RepID=A0AAW1TQ51_9CUCU
MSRKYRTEQQKLSQLNAEVQEELDRVKLQREQIFGPLIWKDLPHLKIRILDLKPARYKDVLNLIKENYFEENLLFRNVQFSKDEQSVQSFLGRVSFICNYKQSIIAVDLDSDQIAGVLLLRAIPKGDCARIFSVVEIINGDAFKEVRRFVSQVTKKVNIYDYFGVDTYLEYVLLCVDQKYRRQGIGFEMMKCGNKIARSLRCPVIAGVFESNKFQKYAERIGMKILYLISYLDYKDEDGEMIFAEPGAGNYFCALMASEVRPPTPPPMPPPKDKFKIMEERKLTRVQRLAEIALEKSKSQRKTSVNA